jgi:hypothetical protein
MAAAQSSASTEPRLILGPSLGNLGFGPETGLRLNEHFGLRVGVSYVSLETEHEWSEPDFNFHVTPPTAGAMLDYYPFQSGFRLTGGLRYNAETPGLIDGPTSAITISGLPFTPSAGHVMGGGQGYLGYAPYGGLGLQSSFWEGRLELVFDLGVYYQGVSRHQAEATRSAAAGSEAGANSEGAEEDLGFLGFYPIIGLSATYRF